MHFIKKFFEAANQTAEAVNRQIIYITQRNLNLGLDLAKSLASARDPIRDSEAAGELLVEAI